MPFATSTGSLDRACRGGSYLANGARAHQQIMKLLVDTGADVTEVPRP